MADNIWTDALSFHPFRIDLGRGTLWHGQKEVRLKPKVYAMLVYLVERPQQLIPKRELLRALWGDAHVGEAVLKTHLNELRRALCDDARHPRFIETVPRRGCRFIAPVQKVFTEREPLATGGAGPRSILVGRDAELEILMGALNESSSRGHQLMFVTGEAGIGKTSLIKAFSEKVAARSDLLVAAGQCIEHGAGEAYLPILEALSRVCRGATNARVLSLLQQHAPNWLSQTPEVMDSRRRERSPSETAPEHTLRQIGSAILLVSRTVPLVLIIEDLHWADYSTMALIEYLATSPEPARLLIVGSYRLQELDASKHPLRALRQRLDAHARCRSIEVGYLAEQDVYRYLYARFPHHRLPEELGRAVQRHTSGNPLFVVRVVEDLTKQHVIGEVDGIWQVTGSLEAVSTIVPDSVVALIERDVERLDDVERAILQTASVVGVDFDVRAVAAALEQHELLIEDVCTTWSHQARFVKAHHKEAQNDGATLGRYTFLHVLYQQVVYARIGPMRRAHLHGRLGYWFEANAEHLHTSSATLARHFEQGNEYPRAIVYRQAAADHSMRQGAHREAIDHYEVALALLTKLADARKRNEAELDLLLGIGVPLAMTRGYTAPETERAYVRSSELSAHLMDPKRTMIALAGAATCHFVRGAYVEAERAGEELFHTAQGQSDLDAEIEAHLIIGVSSFYLGQFLRAQTRLARVIELYDAERHAEHIFSYRQDPRVLAQAFLAWTHWHLGHSTVAVKMADDARAFADALNDSFSICCSMSLSLMLHHSRRDFERCEQIAQQQLLLTTDRRFAFYLEGARLTLGVVAVEKGDLAFGLEQLRCARQKRQAMGAGINRSLWSTTLVEAYMKAGLLDEAAVVLAEAFDAVEFQRERFWEPEVYRLAGELMVLGVDIGQWIGNAQPATSEAAFAEAIARAKATGSVALERRATESFERFAGVQSSRPRHVSKSMHSKR